jgi:nucleotide-binding universal stress UspA family protein
MRVVAWIVEGTWTSVLDAVALLPEDADVLLLHVAGGEAEAIAREARHGLLGRRAHEPPPHERDPVSLASEEEAEALLEEAAARLGRPSARAARRGGRPAHLVLDELVGADLLVLARDGEPGHQGPRSIGHAGRFVLDHAPCDVLLVQAGRTGP